MIRPSAAPRSRSSAVTTVTFAQAARSTSSATAPESKRGRIAVGDRRAVRLEQLEQPLVAEGRHLDRLAERGPELSLGERPERLDVDDDRARLVERPDQVLALGEIDAGLATDRRIDLGDERGRDLDEPDAAQVHRREEAGRIAERAAADGHQHLVAADAQPGELAGGGLDDGQSLRRLALGQHHLDDLATALAQAGREPLAHGSPRAGLADEDGPPGPGRVELGGQRVRRDPGSEHDPADRRRGAQEGRGRAGAVRGRGRGAAIPAIRSSIASTTPWTSAIPSWWIVAAA